MIEEIKTPFIGVNDNECNLISFNVEEGTFVEKEDLICEVETTKATFEVFSPSDGYVYFKAKINDDLKVGEIIGLISKKPEDKELLFKQYSNSDKNSISDKSEITVKAKILIKKFDINTKDLRTKYPGRKIDSDLVNLYLEEKNKKNQRIGLVSNENSPNNLQSLKIKVNQKKVGIIGGVGGGGALIVIDSMLNSNDLIPIAVFDSDESYIGQSIIGIPVVGNHRHIDDWIKQGKIDHLIIAFNKNLKERESTFNLFKSKGYSFVNIIDSKSDIRSAVQIGEGNVILSNTYIGTASEIGDNNFISANVSLEHGNILGSHCSFGPAVFTSGNVTIEDRIRFGTGIHIEPNITIKNDAIISSGSTIVNHVPESTIVK